MNRRNGLLVLGFLAVAPFGLYSCDNAAGGTGVQIGCGSSTQGMCVTRCNLGCTSSGCNITEIAVNQRLSWDFSLNINPDTVNSNTIKIRTATGNEPVGTFLVQGKTIFFFPESKVIGQKTFFGFASGETYTLTIPSADESLETVESMSGDVIAKTFTCRLKVTRGIIDFDGKPPTASMLIPSVVANCVDGKTLILIEFSEVVDSSTLLGDTRTAGVTFGLAQFDAQGNCSPKDLPVSGSRTITIDRLTQRTRLLFQPAFELPGSFCVRVRVTDRVRDLSGKRAKAVNFEFKTCATPGVDKVITEKFDNPGQTRDDERNGAKWAPGNVVPAFVGGSGALGDFNVRFGRDEKIDLEKDAEGRTIYTWNTDESVIPGLRTLSGQDVKVTNGVYEFTNFVLKEGEHMRFVGSKPPVIRVTGKMEILGVLTMAAPDGVKPKSPVRGRPPLVGDKGDAGAIGAGRGGDGGDSPHKTGTKNIHGTDGEDMNVPAGHPLAGDVAGTGGKGSRANPEDGDDEKACFSAYQLSISQQGAAGGGGAGGFTPGTGGMCVDNGKGANDHPPIKEFVGTVSAISKAALPEVTFTANHGRKINSKFDVFFSNTNSTPKIDGRRRVTATAANKVRLDAPGTSAAGTAGTGLFCGDFGKPSVGGKGVSIAKLQNRTEKSSFLYLVSGAGGGGSGASPHGSFDERSSNKKVAWSPGGGGQGGGGALHLQIGGDLFVATRGLITVKGGDAIDYEYDTNDFWNMGPGGPGGGGSVLVQLAGLPDVRGPIVATGGEAGRMDSDANFDLRLDSLSGKAGDGVIRFESDPVIPIARLGTLLPAAKAETSGKLRPVDYDDQSVLATKWYDTNLAFPPKYVRYEIDAVVNNKKMVFSDDPNKGVKADDNAPITILFQGAQIDPDTKLPDPDSLSKWYVGTIDGLNLAGGNGFRVLVRFNQTTGAQLQQIRYLFRG